MNAKPTIDESLAQKLVANQFPKFANLAIRSLKSGGTDNAVFRLGEQLVLRLPVASYAAGQLQKEMDILPSFSELPLQVPELVGVGRPSSLLDASWCIYSWIEGEDLTELPRNNSVQTATSLGGFLLALRDAQPNLKYLAGDQNHSRGIALSEWDKNTRDAIIKVGDEFATEQLLGYWTDSLAVPARDEPPVWLHGDLHSGNLVAAADGKLAAVIDFGLAGVGDPSVDLKPAWWMFQGESRNAFRQTMQIGDEEWLRGRGWALAVALSAYSYYRGTDKSLLTNMARHAICEVLADNSG